MKISTNRCYSGRRWVEIRKRSGSLILATGFMARWPFLERIATESNMIIVSHRGNFIFKSLGEK